MTTPTPVTDVQGTIVANASKTFWYDPSQSTLTHNVVFVTATTGTFSVGSATKVDMIVDFWYTISTDNTTITFTYCTKTNTWNKNFYVNIKYPTIAPANLTKSTTIQMTESADFRFTRNGVVWDPLYCISFGTNPLPTGISDALYADRKDFYGVTQSVIKKDRKSVV